MRNIPLLLRRAFINCYLDGCFGIAKGAAYSGLLSIFPVISSVAALLLQANAGAVTRYLSRFLADIIPPGTEELIAHNFAVARRPTGLLIGASLISVWAASSFMASLMEGFRAAYRLPGGRPMLIERGVAIVLVFAAAIPAIAASAFLVFGERLEQALIGSSDPGALNAMVLVAGKAARSIIATIGIVLVTTLLYYIGPNRPQRWRMVWPGAVVATILWFLATILFAWYTRNLGNYSLLYGSIGGVIALLVWMYLLSAIALFGCEYNAERERIRTS